LKNKFLLLFLLLCLSLGACQRETYQPTGTPGAPEAVVSTPLAVPTEIPIESIEDLKAATPQPDWETTYTEANPMSDSEELIAIFQDLYGRFMAQFDRPGWYRFYAGEVGKRVTWVHISAPESLRFDGLLELYDYPEHYAPGFIWPTVVLGPEGQFGFTHGTEAQDDYVFYEPEDVWSFLDDLEPTLDNINYFAGSVSWMGPYGHLDLLRRINGIQNPVSDDRGAHSESSYLGWVETYEGRPVFMLKTTTLYSGALPVMESGESLVRDESYKIYDLQNGGAIANKSDNWYQSGNSKMDDRWWMLNFHLVDWFETLPDREQQIYDEALRRLDEFNQG
jgi:hypothetical protein